MSDDCRFILRKIIRIISGFIAIFLVASPLAGCAPSATPTIDRNNATDVGIAIGNTAPAFTLTTPNNNTISLQDFRGGYILLNFFATWCVPCREEMPAIQSAYERYHRQGFTVLAVTSSDPASDVEQYISELGLTFPLLLDPEEQASRAYQITAYPTSFFIGPDGVIQDVVIGQMEDGQVEEKVARLVSGSAPGAPMTTEPPAQPAPTATIPIAATLNGCVTANILNVRAGPGTGFEVIRGLVSGECVAVDARSADGAWLRLAQGTAPSGARLWVSSQYLQLDGNLNQLAIQE